MSADNKPKKASKKHIADVQEPGTSAPSETSKPVIVTNRPLLKDPMVVDKAASSPELEDKTPAAPVSSTAKPKLQPSTEPVPSDDDVAETGKVSDGVESATESNIAREPKTSSEPEAAPHEPTATDAPETSSGAAATAEGSEPQPEANNVPSTDNKPKNTAAQQAELEAAEQAKHDATIQQLIDSKQYVLPINTIEKRKNKQFVILGVAVAVILVLIWLDIALDAGIIRLGGLKPPTHFFSN